MGGDHLSTGRRRGAQNRLNKRHPAPGSRRATAWGAQIRPPAQTSRFAAFSFSWRLLLAPADVLHYVVVHELCHLREPSHQKAFWRLLGSVRPGWQRELRWLREHGQELHDYRPEVPVES